MNKIFAACAVTAVALSPLEAAACGCFASSTTVDPVIQAGERIAFATTGNTVTASVQISFQGDAKDFGWILPVPGVPTVKVGSDELFEVLDTSTRPSFTLTTTPQANCQRSGPTLGCGARAVNLAVGSVDLGGQDAGAGPSPLVLRDTAGPYDYAVLKADSLADLTAWLDANRFFVPGASDAALAPYIRPGGYFLVLKLRSGKTVGDLRPVVLDYTSDYPMIPLVLTSATAVPNMGIEVFLLGAGRGVPRNFHHVEVNQLKLDWSTGANYGALVTAAVAEAPKKHAFVTEYAGPPTVATGQLTQGGFRFGSKATLSALPTAADFVEYLYGHGFAPRGTTELSASVLSILEQQIPYPPLFDARGITPQQFYASLRLYLSDSYRTARADDFAGWPGTSYDGPTLADAVWAEVAQPILDAEAMLEAHPRLTRLFTTLSPEDMTEDPVFAFNATLPDVAAARTATRATSCDSTPSTLTAGGYTAPDTELTAEKVAAMPNASRIEVLSEDGPAQVVSEYQPDWAKKSPTGGGCAVTDGAIMIGLGALWLVLRRRTVA